MFNLFDSLKYKFLKDLQNILKNKFDKSLELAELSTHDLNLSEKLDNKSQLGDYNRMRIWYMFKN